MSYWQEQNDLLERETEAKYLVKFLENRVLDKKKRNRTASYVLNIDAAWGQGKSFFLKGLFQELELAKHPTIIIDAWRDDFSDDPLTAVVASFDAYLRKFETKDRSLKKRITAAGRAVRRDLGKLSLLAAKGVTKRAITSVMGEAAKEFTEAISEAGAENSFSNKLITDAENQITEFSAKIIDKYAEKKLENFNEAKLSLENFHDSLATAVKAITAGELTPPFFVLIDELDRCRPTYAIAMLERIKHLFDVEDVVFILSTDTTQLSNSIKAVYGNDFDSQHYLLRFFDRTYKLATPRREKLVAYLVDNSLIDLKKIQTSIESGYVDTIVSIAEQFDMEIRQIEKSIDLLEIICTVWEEVVPMELVIIFPLIASFLTGNDLSDSEKIKTAFLKKNPNNSVPRHIGSANIGAVAQKMFLYRDKTLYDVRKECTEIANRYPNNRSAVDQIFFNIASAEVSARGRNDLRPLIDTYPDRVRMAGHFLQR